MVRETDEDREPASQWERGGNAVRTTGRHANLCGRCVPSDAGSSPSRSLPVVAVRPAGVKAVFENDVGKLIGAFGARYASP